MSSEVFFPEVDPQSDFNRDCLSFPARVDGKPIRCLITFEFLTDRFGARDMSEQEARRAFQESKPAILALAESQIRMDRIGPNNEVLLTTDTTSLKEIVYQDRLKQWAEVFRLARRATRWLEEVLGASAGMVSAEWDRGEDARGRPVVTLQISDFAGSATAVFEPNELESVSHMRLRFYRLWGDLLQVRSHRQLHELMAGPAGE